MAQRDWRLFLRDAPVVTVKAKKRKAVVQSEEEGGPAKKKKKPKTSRGAMHLLGVGEERVVRGVAKAAGSYAERSKKSALARKDGAIRDLLDNVAKAQQSAVGQIAKIPRDLTRVRELKKGSKRLQKSLRRLAW
jgi:hypothetical protein